MNTAARDMVGASRGNDVLRKSLFSFVADDDREPSKRFIDQVCANQAGSLEFRLSSISGVVRTVEARGVTLPAAVANTNPSAFLVLRDVTTRKRFERSVEETLEAGSGDEGAEADDAGGDRTRLTERIAQLEGAYEALRAERDRLLANLEDARTNLEETKTGTRREPSDSLRHLETERDKLRRILDEERTQHEAEIAEALTARNELARRLRETESQGIRSADDARESAALELHTWKTECHRLETERQALQASLADLQTALDERLRRESEGGVTGRVREELEQAVREAESTAQRAADDARDSIASLELQLKDVDRARAQALADRDEAAAALRRERARHAEFESDEISIRRVLELRLQHAEAEVKRLTAERGPASGTVRSRDSRHEGLLRELLESDQHGALAERWIAHCADLEQALDAARTEFQQLAEWARARNGLTPARQGSTAPNMPLGDDRHEARHPAQRPGQGPEQG